MHPTPTTAAASHSRAQGTLAGTLLCRIVVPAWILAGASFKLWERNPQLLPKPVTDVTDFLFVRSLGISREAYLDPAMRGMVAVEIAAAILMFVAPVQAARLIGQLMLSLFCAILGVLIASGAASCGCFGASGPSPGWMLGIDLTMLVGLVALAPRGQRLPSAEVVRRVLTVLPVPALLGLAVAYGVPQRAAVVLPADGSPPATAPATVPATDAPPAANAPPSATPPPNAPPAPNAPTPAPAAPAQPAAAAGAAPWPPAPATAMPWYAPEFEQWKGQRLDAQELMLLVPRPLPANLNAGRHHVVLMREDCEHCHELLMKYFGGALATPTMSIAVPDATGEPLENPCGECGKTAFPKGITYVFSTPVLLTVQDGVVVGVCTDSEDADKVRAAIDAR